MPRGRPKGSKNKTTVPKVLEGHNFAVKWTNHKGISWYVPMDAPYLDSDAAAKVAESFRSNSAIKEVVIVDMTLKSNPVVEVTTQDEVGLVE